MKFGLTAPQLDFIYKTVVRPLQALDARVFCYGSRARGDFKKFSDLDLMVESKNPQSIDLNPIQEILQNSSFPYKVDLVHISDFAQNYRAGYEAEKVLLE